MKMHSALIAGCINCNKFAALVG